MNVELWLGMRADRRAEVLRIGSAVLTAAAALVTLPVLAADAGGSASSGKSRAVTLEPIAGTSVKRVILTHKAAERLGIETAQVREEVVVRKQMVSGLVILPVEKQAAPKVVTGGLGTFGGYARSAAAPSAAAATKAVGDGKTWVLVTLSPGEWEQVAKDKPARLLPLPTREKMVKEVAAHPSGMDPVEDVKRSMLNLYYVVPGKDHGLALHDRMRVELEYAGESARRKVVPYGAVYYDARGTPWVYVNTRPLVFERQRVRVDRIVGDVAVLSEGPDVGTPVASVGAALLFGAEIFGK
jgi:hypothetical protein